MTTQETEKAISEVWALFKETREQIKEMNQETDKKIASMVATVEKTSKDVARVSKDIEALKDKWGHFVESILAPGIKKIFNERGIEIREVHRRVEAIKGGEKMEIDLFAVNSIYVVLVEVKSTLSKDDVVTHLEHLKKFKDFFPLYANHKALGAVSGIIMPKEVTRFAYQQGLFVLGQSGDTIAILNDEKFKPKEW